MDEFDKKLTDVSERFLQVLKDSSDLFFTNTEERMKQNSDECMADALGMLVSRMMGWGIEPTELFILRTLYAGCEDANSHKAANLYHGFYYSRAEGLGFPLGHVALKEAEL